MKSLEKIFNKNENTYENTYKTEFDSLNQGLELLSERKNYIDNITNKRKIIEGNTNMDADIAEHKRVFTQKNNKYNIDLDTYKKEYVEFTNDLKSVAEKVKQCKISTCETNYNILEGDSDEIKAMKRKKKNACKAGCHFNLPRVLNCKDFETFGKTSDNKTCDSNEIKNICSSNNEDIARKKLDVNGVNAWDGCCDCNLERKYSPFYITNNQKYSNCDDFSEGNPNSDVVKACEIGKSSASNKINKPDNHFILKYKNIKGKNDNLIKTSNEILDIVKDLNELNEQIIVSGQTATEKIQNDNLVYEKIQKNIKNLSNKSRNITLEKLVDDKKKLKKSTDLRIYLWGILALGLGLSALRKINQL